MNEGVSMLIARMESNPEDFMIGIEKFAFQGQGSWRALAEAVIDDKRMFTDEEKMAVSSALIDVSRKNFTAKVLELLTAPPVPQEHYAHEYAKSLTISQAGQSAMMNSNILGSAIDRYQRDVAESMRISTESNIGIGVAKARVTRGAL